MKKSHLGLGMMIGAAIGIASASFMQSKDGKAFKKDLKKKTAALQKTVMKQLEKSGMMTKKQYDELVDKVVAHYLKTKEIVKRDAPMVKKALLAAWKDMEREVKAATKG